MIPGLRSFTSTPKIKDTRYDLIMGILGPDCGFDIY